MNTYEQNQIDIARMIRKRQRCTQLLDEFLEWRYHNTGYNPERIRILWTGRIRRATEQEADRYIIRLDELNQQSAMDKLIS
jgi:uncharacterized protein YeeX (DUF496 family)